MPHKKIMGAHKKLQFRTHYEDIKDIKVTILCLVASIFFLALCTTVLLVFKNPLGAYFLAIGEIAFVLVLIYEMKKGAKHFIEENFKMKKLVDIFSEAVFTLSIAFVLFTLIIAVLSLKIVITHSTSQIKIAAAIAIPILIVPLALWETLFEQFKRHLHKFKWFFLLLLLPTFCGFAYALNVSSINQTMQGLNTMQNFLNSTSTILVFAGNATAFLIEQKNVISEALGLTDMQSSLALAALVLLAVLIASKFIESIAKWLIIILIAVFVLLLL